MDTSTKSLPFWHAKNAQKTPFEGTCMDQKSCTTIVSPDPRKSLSSRESHPGVIPGSSRMIPD